MPIPGFSCVSDCFKQSGQRLSIDIHNDIPMLEEKMTELFEKKIIPLLNIYLKSKGIDIAEINLNDIDK
jgi:hypothetical protein